MKIGEADLDALIYGFYNGRLFYVVIGFNQLNNAVIINRTLFEQYGGNPSGVRFMSVHQWEGDKVNILFNYDMVSKEGNLYYFYKPIQREQDSDIAKDSQKRASGLKGI